MRTGYKHYSNKEYELEFGDFETNKRAETLGDKKYTLDGVDGHT